MPETKYIVLRMPVASWDTLSETLKMDCNSSAFDVELREEIEAAMDTIEILHDRTK